MESRFLVFMKGTSEHHLLFIHYLFLSHLVIRSMRITFEKVCKLQDPQDPVDDDRCSAFFCECHERQHISYLYVQNPYIHSGNFGITAPLPGGETNQIFLQCRQTCPETVQWFLFAAFFQTGEAKKRSIGGLPILDPLPKGLAVITRIYPACFAGHLIWPESLKIQS